VPGSKRQTRQNPKHLDGGHAQREAGDDANVVRKVSRYVAINIWAYSLSSSLYVCLDRFDEPADLAAQQSLHRGKGATVASAISATSAGPLRSSK